MIGQEQLQKDLLSHSLADSRKTVLFLGDYGCGKHTLAEEYSKHLGIPLVDITESISFELLSSIQLSTILTIYLIDLDCLTEQAQNILLKFIEEPYDSAYIVLLSSNENRVIPTIANRCYKVKFVPYTKDEIEQILGSKVSDDVMSVCTTPGQVRLLQDKYDDLMQLCTTIINKMSKARFGNALSIVDKINYTDEYDKFDLHIFLNVLMRELCKSYVSGNDKAIKLYNIVCAESQKLIDARLSTKIFMKHLVTLLWKESR